MIDEHGKAIKFLSLKEKGLFWRKVPNNMTVMLHACFVKGYFFYVQARLFMSRIRVSAAPPPPPPPIFV